jgi:hypothetical protein
MCRPVAEQPSPTDHTDTSPRRSALSVGVGGAFLAGGSGKAFPVAAVPSIEASLILCPQPVASLASLLIHIASPHPRPREMQLD